MTFEGFELVIFNCFPHLQASSKYTVCISHLYATAPPPSSSHHPPQQHPGLRFLKKKKQLALLLKRLQKGAICITLFRMYQLSLCGKPKKRTPPSLIWIFLKHAKWEQYSVRPVLTPARHQAWLLHRAACYSRVCCSKRATRKAMSSHPRTT